jgi:glycosyltransferase involved in cell wall biosynthesis
MGTDRISVTEPIISERVDQLVSVIIPTLNEEESLPTTLSALDSQTYDKLEVLVVDSGSTDRTQTIAREHDAKVIFYPGRPMGARWKGFEESLGSFILFLDGDQVLYPDSIERAIRAMSGQDMLVLEETSYRPRGYLQRSLCRQKRSTHAAADPKRGVGPNLYPRFYRRDVLQKAYQGLDEATMARVYAHDDGLLFRRAYDVSKRSVILPKGVMHIEESNWYQLMRHSLKAGMSARSVDMSRLQGDLGREEDRWIRMQRAIKGRYFLMSVVKELFFRFGHRKTR